MNTTNTYLNTDREIWRERPDDFYAAKIHVTKSGEIGIDVGGYVLVASVHQWYAAGRKLIVVNKTWRYRLAMWLLSW